MNPFFAAAINKHATQVKKVKLTALLYAPDRMSNIEYRTTNSSFDILIWHILCVHNAQGCTCWGKYDDEIIHSEAHAKILKKVLLVFSM